jgi:hypothetical protein
MNNVQGEPTAALAPISAEQSVNVVQGLTLSPTQVSARAGQSVYVVDSLTLGPAVREVRTTGRYRATGVTLARSADSHVSAREREIRRLELQIAKAQLEIARLRARGN